jgi:hypothetical protein
MLLNSEWRHECCHNIHGVLLSANLFHELKTGVSSQFESLERFIQNIAHGFELEALVRIGALGYLMSAESNGVNRVIHVQYPKYGEQE